jgi:hypothetical protein
MAHSPVAITAPSTPPSALAHHPQGGAGRRTLRHLLQRSLISGRAITQYVRLGAIFIAFIALLAAGVSI